MVKECLYALKSLCFNLVALTLKTSHVSYVHVCVGK